MASLSNINGLFDVHSTGAILFSTSHGTSGQILRSNGNAAPTWVAASTVIGGPYLPLTGGTLIGPLSGTSATFAGNVTVNNPAITPAVTAISSWSGTTRNPQIKFARIASAVAGEIGYSDPETNLYIGSTTNHDFRIRVNNNDIITCDTAQNVGIGTTSPAEKLEVSGSIKSTSRAIAGSSIPGITLSYDTSNSIALIESWTSKPIGIETAGVRRMTIDSSGNVGINTTNPGSKIDVREDANNVYTGYFYNSSTAANAHGINVQTATTNAGAYAFRVNSGSNSNALVVMGSANVGIGTDNPQNALHIKKEGYQLKLEDGNTTNTCEILASNNTMGFFSDRANAVASSDMIFSIDNSTKMRITTGGDIQIPTNSASLQFQGAGSGSYTSIRRLSSNQLIVANTAGNQVFGIGNGGELAIKVDGSYSAQYTYTSGWNSSMQTLIPTNTLSSNAVYIVTIKCNSLGAAPYYASTVFHIATSPGTNGAGGSVPFNPPTATHISSNAVWIIRLSTALSGRNGLEGYLIYGPNNFNGATIYVRATKIMTL